MPPSNVTEIRRCCFTLPPRRSRAKHHCRFRLWAEQCSTPTLIDEKSHPKIAVRSRRAHVRIVQHGNATSRGVRITVLCCVHTILISRKVPCIRFVVAANTSSGDQLRPLEFH